MKKNHVDTNPAYLIIVLNLTTHIKFFVLDNRIVSKFASSSEDIYVTQEIKKKKVVIFLLIEVTTRCFGSFFFKIKETGDKRENFARSCCHYSQKHYHNKAIIKKH